MKLNEQIKEVLREYNISVDDALPYLFSLYYNFSPTYIPDLIKQKVNMTKIVANKTGIITWNIPLFEVTGNIDNRWEWVENEYVSLFNPIGKDKYKREALIRMKKLFAENPDIRKEEVIGATELYLYNTNPKYVRFPHFFLRKGRGVEETQDILEWVDKFRLTQERVDRDVSRRLL